MSIARRIRCNRLTQGDALDRSGTSNGFLSGSCEFTQISSTQVSVTPAWTFDDRDANVKSRFDQSFIATNGATGTADCANGAMIKWSFEQKATEL